MMELFRRRMLLARILTGAEGSGPSGLSPSSKGETLPAATSRAVESSSARMPDCASSEMRLATIGWACEGEKTASLGSEGLRVGRRGGAASSGLATLVLLRKRLAQVPPES